MLTIYLLSLLATQVFVQDIYFSEGGADAVELVEVAPSISCGGRFLQGMRDVGDRNGDDISDIALKFAGPSLSDLSVVELRSGATGGVLAIFSPPLDLGFESREITVAFGGVAASPQRAIGTPRTADGRGRVYVDSGGSMQTITGPRAWESFGLSLSWLRSSLGKRDDMLLIGAPGMYSPSHSVPNGRVYCYTSPFGEPTWYVEGGRRFGQVVEAFAVGGMVANSWATFELSIEPNHCYPALAAFDLSTGSQIWRTRTEICIAEVSVQPSGLIAWSDLNSDRCDELLLTLTSGDDRVARLMWFSGKNGTLLRRLFMPGLSLRSGWIRPLNDASSGKHWMLGMLIGESSGHLAMLDVAGDVRALWKLPDEVKTHVALVNSDSVGAVQVWALIDTDDSGRILRLGLPGE